MKTTQLDKSKMVLVFNPLKKLVAVFRSPYAAAKSFNTRIQSIQYACDGTCMSCQGHYFRELNEDVTTMDDIIMSNFNVLTLQEYDRMCGVKRKVYRTAKMERKGMKYKKHPKK